MTVEGLGRVAIPKTRPRFGYITFATQFAAALPTQAIVMLACA